MKRYDPRHIRNIALLGSAGSGKTTLAEAMMFEAGVITRMGKIEDKNTQSDFHEIEHEKQHSIFNSILHTEWKNYKINIIDTPGAQDFIGEVVSALRIANTGVLTLSASEGVSVMTEVIWNYTEEFKKPMIIAVNKIDSDKSDFNKTIEEAKNSFGRAVCVVQYPLNEGTKFDAFVDVLNMVMYKFETKGQKPVKLAIPDSEIAKAQQLHNDLLEAIAENDEVLMNMYFEKGNLTEDELRLGLRKAMLNHQLFPVFCLSAKENMGVGRLMSYIDNVAPSPVDVDPIVDEESHLIKCDPNDRASLFVFKTYSEPHVGELSYFKVYSGMVKPGMDLINVNTGNVERIGHLYAIDGKKRVEVEMIVAGDIGATVKLKNTHTNNTLHEKNHVVKFKPIEYPKSKLRSAIEPINAKDEEKLAAALHHITEEDPTLVIEYSKELKQTILYSQGEIHLNVVKWRLDNQFHIPTQFIETKVPFRETIQKQVKVHYRHKKQSGGAGQFADVHLVIEPYYEGMPQVENVSVRGTETHELPWGGVLVFQNCIVGGVIDARFLPAILKGVLEKMNEGPLVGCHARDVRVSVVDGSMHPVDSNEAAFKTAALMAFKDGFMTAEPKILEPIYDVKITIPNDYTGEVISDLPTRRAMIMGIDTSGNYQVINAKMPLVELDKYYNALRSICQGRANFVSEFAEYSPVPYDIQNKLISSHTHNE